MALVLDASIAAAWFLPDEQNDAADDVMARLIKTPARVPALFWFEARALLIKAERRGRLKIGEATDSMAQLRSFPIIEAGTGNDGQIITLANRHGLSGYDASYLGLALAEKLPLATLDKRLAAAGHAEKVPVLGIIESS